eukprot:7355330-Pyramimonas_sp.AAC.1
MGGVAVGLARLCRSSAFSPVPLRFGGVVGPSCIEACCPAATNPEAVALHHGLSCVVPVVPGCAAVAHAWLRGSPVVIRALPVSQGEALPETAVSSAQDRAR